MTIAELSAFIRDVPDFPKKGILFKDITPLLANGAAFRATIHHLAERAAARKPDVVVAIESRGFVFGAAVAASLGIRSYCFVLLPSLRKDPLPTN